MYLNSGTVRTGNLICKFPLAHPPGGKDTSRLFREHFVVLENTAMLRHNTEKID